MQKNWSDLPKRTVVKRQNWKPLYTRILAAAVSLVVLLVLEFLLLKLMVAWY
jgi:hypothetical protein